MLLRLSSSFLQVILILFVNVAKTQELKHDLEFNRSVSLHVFSDKTNKISGYATGKYLAYNIDLLNGLGLNSIGIIFDHKDLSRIKGIEKLNANKFGNAYSLIGTLNFSLVKYKGLKLIFSPGIGFGYLDETWYTNKNPIIRSHLNFAPMVAVKMSYEINGITKILTGLNILHFSNAAIRVPNNGINMLGLSLGIAKCFSANEHKLLELFNNKELGFKRHSVELGVNIGHRGVYYSKKSLYKSGFYLGYKYLFNSLFGISTGVDGIYYYSPFDLNRYTETYQSKATSFDRWRIGLGVGPTVNIGKLDLSAFYGYYLHYQSYMPIYTYWSASIKYKVNEWMAFQPKLYGHREEVDFLGLGMVFNWSL